MTSTKKVIEIVDEIYSTSMEFIRPVIVLDSLGLHLLDSNSD